MPVAKDTVRIMLSIKKADLDLIEAAADGIPVSTWCRAVVVREARRIKDEKDEKGKK